MEEGADESPGEGEVKAATPPGSPAAENKTSSANDKYSYLTKGYTSEIFKIHLLNIPARMGYQVNCILCECEVFHWLCNLWRKNLRKYLNSLDLKPVKIKKPESRRGTAFINFRCEEDRTVLLFVQVIFHASTVCCLCVCLCVCMFVCRWH